MPRTVASRARRLNRHACRNAGACATASLHSGTASATSTVVPSPRRESTRTSRIDRGQAFAHAGKAVAGHDVAAAAVVGDLELQLLAVRTRSRTRASLARAWRWMLVTASRTVIASTVSTFAGSATIGEFVVERTPLDSSSSCAEASSAAMPAARMPVTARRTCASASRATRFDVGDFAPRRHRIAIEQAIGQFGFQRDQRQRVAEQIVQVAADAFALGHARRAGGFRRG